MSDTETLVQQSANGERITSPVHVLYVRRYVDLARRSHYDPVAIVDSDEAAQAWLDGAPLDDQPGVVLLDPVARLKMREAWTVTQHLKKAGT